MRPVSTWMIQNFPSRISIGDIHKIFNTPNTPANGHCIWPGWRAAVSGQIKRGKTHDVVNFLVSAETPPPNHDLFMEGRRVEITEAADTTSKGGLFNPLQEIVVDEGHDDDDDDDDDDDASNPERDADGDPWMRDMFSEDDTFTPAVTVHDHAWVVSGATKANATGTTSPQAANTSTEDPAHTSNASNSTGNEQHHSTSSQSATSNFTPTLEEGLHQVKKPLGAQRKTYNGTAPQPPQRENGPPRSTPRTVNQAPKWYG